MDSTAQCQPGILDAILALIAQVLGGTAPATALSDAGAVTVPIAMAPIAMAPTAGQPEATQPGAEILTTFLPVGDSVVPVVGLAPLLETVAARRDALALSATPLGVLQPAAASVTSTPAADDADPTTPDGQLGQLAALLAPLGLQLDLVNGTADPMLIPVLGSLGCPAEPPADPQAADPQAADPQADPRGGVR